MRAPFTTDYSPEINGGNMLNDKDATYYQFLIDILCWVVEIGRIGIFMEISAMFLFTAVLKYGHLIQVLHIFAYLKCHHSARLVFDQSYSDVKQEDFLRED